MPTFNLTIVTPERLFYSGEAEQVTFRSTEGEIGILPGHVPMVVALSAAPLHIKAEGEWKEAALSGGFARINGDSVTILSDTVEWPEEIEVNRAVEAKKRAEERMQNHLSEIEYLRSQIALQRALARIKVTKEGKPGG